MRARATTKSCRHGAGRPKTNQVRRARMNKWKAQLRIWHRGRIRIPSGLRSSLPAARPAADLSQPCAPPVGLSPATRSPGVGSQSCGAKYPGFCADSKGV